MATLFERVGGFAAVSKIVLSFYGRALESDVLAPYFEDVDMRRLMDHQTKFVAFVMGGPTSFSDEHLRRAHERLGIDDGAFDEMIETFRETLEDFDVDDEDVDTVIQAMEIRRPIIVVAPR